MKVAVRAAAGTVTEVGTVSVEAVLASSTVELPVLETVTVQVLVCPEDNPAGLQDSAVTLGGAVSPMDAVFVLPLIDAVTVAVWSAATAPAVAVNVTLVEVAGTATDAETVRAAVLLLNATLPRPTWDNVAVQVLVPPAVKEVGAQLTAVMEGSTAVTVPPAPLMVNAFPAALAPRVFVTAMLAAVAPAAIVTLITATVPFCMTDEFKPSKTQVYSPTPELHVIDLPAVTEVPEATASIEAMLVEEYASVH